MLILAEIGWPSSFFSHYFPVLGPDFGLGALGIFQGLIGAAILSHHVDDFALVSAFFLFALGCLNMLIGLIFRAGAKHKRSLMAWRDEKKSVLPRNTTGSTWRSQGDDVESVASHDEKKGGVFGLGFGRQGEKAAGLKGVFPFIKPMESNL